MYRGEVFIQPDRIFDRNNLNYGCVINDILRSTYARRALNIPRRRLMNDAECEILRIFLMCTIMPIHISVGTNAVVFWSETDIIVRRIIDPTSLIDELLSALSPYLLNE